nr:BRCA1-associated protein [Ciona intestinalis]|eukprot:XP_002130211.1 BRCA1-associated protein [Ciona intestinalis]
MKISLVHIRLSIAAGHSLPDVSFKAACINSDGSLKEDFLSVEDEHVETSLNNVSPMKPCKWSTKIADKITFDGLDENDRHELLIKLKGQRYYRQLTITTHDNTELTMSQNETGASCSSEGNIKSVVGVDGVVGGKVNEDTKHTKVASKKKKQKPNKQTNDEQRMNENEAEASSNQKARHSSENIFPFHSGNPAVDVTNGVVHLYKSNYKVVAEEPFTHPDTNTLCMLAVPASIDAHGILEFTAPFINVIRRIRIIRDRTPSQYMVLLLFCTSQDACNFYFNFNNQHFSSLIPEEICHLAFVASVEATSVYDETNGGFIPLSNSTELPDCMVCLERMDESVQGVLTILCNHSFHASCLRQWEDQCCPVCRYVQTPHAQSNNKCMVCGSVEDLWICLVCGNVGCGRYTSEHAQQHYIETQHNYAMALSDNRVWDYAGDYFVHRLFQNKEDGKLVEKGGEHEDKVEGMQLECMYLLTSQLESQRKYWEDEVNKAEIQGVKKYEEINKQLETTMMECKGLGKKVEDLEKEKQSLKHRNQQLSNKFTETLADLSNERELNKSLVHNQDVWKSKVIALEEQSLKQKKEIDDLREELRDVMFYIQASQTIEKEGGGMREDIRGGQILVGPGTSSGGDQKKRGKKKR